MGNHAKNNERACSIVLAGGEDERLGSFIQRWLGRPRPKQYCTFVGTRSLFQHTLGRADRLTAPDRKVIVMARSHTWEVWHQLSRQSSGMVLQQPADRGRAAEIFLALTHIQARDAQATVVIYPSDHFVYPEERFLDSVQQAMWTVEWLPDRLVLLGIPPDHLEPDYGWLEPVSSSFVRPIIGFTRSAHSWRNQRRFRPMRHSEQEGCGIRRWWWPRWERCGNWDGNVSPTSCRTLIGFARRSTPPMR